VFFRDITAADPATLEAEFVALERELWKRLEAEGVPPERRRLERTFEMCYAGQWRVLTVPVSGTITTVELEACAERYVEIHHREHALTLPDRPVEVHGLTATAIGITEKLNIRPSAQTGRADAALIGARNVFWREVDNWTETKIYNREGLFSGASIEGPAIVEQLDSTTVIPQGMTAQIDQYRNLVINVT
jgi:N-methylhydantoinase A